MNIHTANKYTVIYTILTKIGQNYFGNERKNRGVCLKVITEISMKLNYKTFIHANIRIIIIKEEKNGKGTILCIYKYISVLRIRTSNQRIYIRYFIYY